MRALLLFAAVALTGAENQGDEKDHVSHAMPRARRAAYHRDQGIALATQDDYEPALAHFRAAARADPDTARYWSDLGVTEMRMGMYRKALRRFLRALAVDPTYHLAQQNIDELQRFMDADAFDEGMLGDVQHEQRHHVEAMPRVDAAELWTWGIDADNGSTTSVLNRPFVAERAAQTWGWDLAAFDLDRLVAAHGDSTVDFYPHNMRDESVHPYLSPLRDAAAMLTDPLGIYTGVDASEPGTYLQWNLHPSLFDGLLQDAHAQLPPLLNDSHWTARCFRSHDVLADFHIKTHWKMLLVGEAPAGMFNHKDTLQSSSWQVQIVGRKRWHLCAPTEDGFLYRAGDVDAFNPDYVRYPLFLQARCYEAILEPGDAIYYPKNYWHQTLNLDTPTVSLTGTLATGNCHRDTFRELKAECDGKARIFVAEPALCEDIARCASMFEERFAGAEGDALDL